MRARYVRGRDIKEKRPARGGLCPSEGTGQPPPPQKTFRPTKAFPAPRIPLGGRDPRSAVGFAERGAPPGASYLRAGAGN
eukprot:5274965-Pyramimonas_sp.AAC.1